MNYIVVVVIAFLSSVLASPQVYAMDEFAGVKLRDKCASLAKLKNIQYRHYSNAPNEENETVLTCGGQVDANYKGGYLNVKCEGGEVIGISYLKDVPKNLATADFEEIIFSEYGKPNRIKRNPKYNYVYYGYSEEHESIDDINIQFSPGIKYGIHFYVPDIYKAIKVKETEQCFRNISKKSFTFTAN